MSWIRVIPPGDADVDDELAETYRKIGGRDGTVDNILSIHSLSPPGLRAHYDLYKSCMYGRSDLSRAQREMIAVVVSLINRCHY